MADRELVPKIDDSQPQIMQVFGIAGRPGDTAPPLGGSECQTKATRQRFGVDEPHIPGAHLIRTIKESGGDSRGVDIGVVLPNPAPLDRDRSHQHVACGGVAA